ncbi:MAG: glycosyltransferase [Sulfuricurvum sp.]|jgi:hypothetical protein|uniref:glycosyltransferase n=1 Tax=Sulfuricurvum sp. TaxID=2025608 RepID=UPI0025EC0A59|nr:glycosyltransferase [Sulfuricurvum sp.]MCK9372278.1 glycosyltransferase [Sulfuricurvum sp.]
MENLAPVAVCTYSRINHLKQTIEALQKNTLAKQTELYIFSDAPRIGDEEIVRKVREYIRTVDGFKKVHIVERQTNGIIENLYGAIEQLLNIHGKIIFLEDDNVTSNYFLKFMNESLNHYQDDKRILTISGYMLDVKEIHEGKDDVFLQRIFSAWGFATWKDRKIIEIGNKTDFICLLKGKYKIANKIFKYNPPMFKALSNIKRMPNKVNPLDYKISAYQFLFDKYTLYPKQSFVKNIGADGSGVHAKVTNIWDVELNESNLSDIKLAENVEYNERYEKLISERAMSFRKSLNYTMRKIFNYVWVFFHIIFCKKDK